ncbi:MAG: hypothetical protein R2755_16630 [Acidimicrobiales bacterium]
MAGWPVQPVPHHTEVTEPSLDSRQNPPPSGTAQRTTGGDGTGPAPVKLRVGLPRNVSRPATEAPGNGWPDVAGSTNQVLRSLAGSTTVAAGADVVPPVSFVVPVAFVPSPASTVAGAPATLLASRTATRLEAGAQAAAIVASTAAPVHRRNQAPHRARRRPAADGGATFTS